MNVILSIFFIPIAIIIADVRLRLNKDRTMLYLTFDDSCTWNGDFGQNCITPHIGGSRVAITNSDERAIMTSMGQDSGVWLGGHKFKGESKFTWDTGVPFNYAIWGKDQPDNQPPHIVGDGPNYCIYFENGYFWDSPCYARYRAARQFVVTKNLANELYNNLTTKNFSIDEESISTLLHLNATIPKITTVKLKLNRDRTVLYLYHEGLCNWNGTVGENCIAKYLDQSSKVIIRDQVERDMVKSMITGTTWIGGISPTKNGTFKWFNGEELSYQSWQPGEPNGLFNHILDNGDSYCIRMYDNGNFDDVPCYFAHQTIRQFKVTKTLSNELYRNITSNEFVFSKESIAVLIEVFKVSRKN